MRGGSALFIIAAAFLLHCVSTYAGSEEEILLAFKASIDNWDEVYQARGMDGWRSCEPGNCTPLCSWSGVKCDPFSSNGGNSVTAIDLHCDDGCAVRLVGTLAPELAQLQHLEELNLHGNAFYGPLPAAEWGANGTFPKLTTLTLSDNHLSGPLPEEWGTSEAFLTLVELNLAFNKLSGTFPTAWATTNTSFINLMSWNFGSNALSGTLPTYINGLITMTSVAFHNNLFTGAIPPDWGNQGWHFNSMYNDTQELQELYLHGNLLTGELPSEWGAPESFCTLKRLTLGDNPLATTLPLEWGTKGSWASLQSLNISHAHLTGSLPEAWGEGFPNLATLVIDANNLTGTVPASWAGMGSLASVYVQPGNPQLCPYPPAGASFQLCEEKDMLCHTSTLQPGNSSACAAANPIEAAAGVSDSSGSGSGVAVGAVVGAVVGTLSVVALVAGFLLHRRRRQQQAAKQLKPLPALPGDAAFPPSAFAFHEEGSVWGGKEGSGTLSTFTDKNVSVDLSRGPSAQSSAPASRQSSSRSSLHCSLAGCFGCGGLPVFGSGGEASDSSGSSSRSISSSGQPQQQQHPPQPPPSQPPQPPVQSQLPPLPPLPPQQQQQQQQWGVDYLPPSASRGAGNTEGRGSKWSMEFRRSLEMRMGGRRSVDGRRRSLCKDPCGSMSGSEANSGDSQGAAVGDYNFGSADLEAFASDWEIPEDEIEIMKRPDGSHWQLGSGGFGCVYKALRNEVQTVAVKVLTAVPDGCAMNDSDFLKEIAILRACRDTNIVQFQGVCIQDERTMLVTEYMEGGNLFSNIRHKKVSWYKKGKKIAEDVAKGLVFLHSKRVVHFDVKSANVLLTRDGTAKLGDVGMSKLLTKDYITGAVGTLAWSAPEMLWGHKCGTSADIYSFGIVLWEICTGEQPVRGQLRDVSVPEECPEEVRDLILSCLEPNPASRPTAIQLVELLRSAPATPVQHCHSAPLETRSKSGGEVAPAQDPCAQSLPPLPPPARSADAQQQQQHLAASVGAQSAEIASLRQQLAELVHAHEGELVELRRQMRESAESAELRSAELDSLRRQLAGSTPVRSSDGSVALEPFTAQELAAAASPFGACQVQQLALAPSLGFVSPFADASLQVQRRGSCAAAGALPPAAVPAVPHWFQAGARQDDSPQGDYQMAAAIAMSRQRTTSGLLPVQGGLVRPAMVRAPSQLPTPFGQQ